MSLSGRPRRRGSAERPQWDGASLTVTGGDLRAHESNAEILSWQSRLRVAAVILAGVPSTVLRLLGVFSTDSLATSWMRPTTALGICVAAGAIYCVTVIALAGYGRRRGRAGPWLIGLTILADLLMIFGSAYLVTPPAGFERTLILAFFSIQLTQFSFGRGPSALSLFGVTVGYLALLLGATARHVVQWQEEAWTLAMFAAGVALFTHMHGAFKARLDRIAALFERAQEGDFSEPYDVSVDDRPDAITVVGRAYNRMRTQLATIVLTDPLSGCYNRRGFEEQLAREVSRAVRARSPLGLLAIDIDHFKAINDTFGHLAGDEAIRECGALLRATARLGDVVARTGGEEFMILCPETDEQGASHLGDRILDAFHRHEFQALRGKRPITVSIGVVADIAAEANIGEGLKARADEALYAAKRAGRDRIIVWRPGHRQGGAP